MASRTHGEAPSKTSNHVFRGTPEYRAWVGMVARCYSPNNTRFHRYGGRGITVCERWRGDGGYERFLADMGRKPSPRHSLGRVNNDANYEPENCRWETPAQQNANTRRTRLLVIDGEAATISEWSRRSGRHIASISHRLGRGLDAKSAVFGQPGIPMSEAEPRRRAEAAKRGWAKRRERASDTE